MWSAICTTRHEQQAQGVGGRRPHGSGYYEYIFSDNYEIKKNGYANIYTDNTRNSIALVTCKEESNDAQVVYIGYLINMSSYLKEQ